MASRGQRHQPLRFYVEFNPPSPFDASLGAFTCSTSPAAPIFPEHWAQVRPPGTRMAHELESWSFWLIVVAGVATGIALLVILFRLHLCTRCPDEDNEFFFKWMFEAQGFFLVLGCDILLSTSIRSLA